MTIMMLMVIPLAQKIIVVCVIFYINKNKYNSLPTNRLPFDTQIATWVTDKLGTYWIKDPQSGRWKMLYI